jgi:hypothetical protein
MSMRVFARFEVDMKSPFKPTYLVDAPATKKPVATTMPDLRSPAPPAVPLAHSASASIDEVMPAPHAPPAVFVEAASAASRSATSHASPVNDNTPTVGEGAAPRNPFQAIHAVASAIRGMSPQQIRGVVVRALEPGGAGEQLRTMVIDWLERAFTTRQQAIKRAISAATAGAAVGTPATPLAPTAATPPRVEAPIPAPPSEAPLRFQMVNIPNERGGGR